MTNKIEIRKVLRILGRGYLYLCAAVCTLGLIFAVYSVILVLSIPRHSVELPNGVRLNPTSRIANKVELVAPNGTTVLPSHIAAVQWNAHYVAGLRYFPRPNDPEMRMQAIRFVYKVGDASAIENHPENRDAFKKLEKQSGLRINTGLTAYEDLAKDPKYLRYEGEE